ncbi:hypothetical protein EVAR_52246_1 [Eumeta japonica]|uniref:Uncharacterized protein n=1 Tax=Eumeta variegata TaxID=151549 RepID=A0A4C1YPR4_EUMVA|nr:hypothetical protein EVAR_52246_1 [Eumeta japonica]
MKSTLKIDEAPKALERFPGGGAERDMASRRGTKGTLTAVSKAEESVPNPIKGATKTGTGKKKLLQKATTTPPVLGTPPANIERAKSSQSKKTRTVASDDVSAVTAAPPAPPKVVVEVGPADAAAAAARESEAGVFTALEAMKSPADLSEDSPRPELRKAASARPDAHRDWRLESETRHGGEARARGPKNISRDVKESVIGKLSVIGELALRLEESRSNYVAELERERRGGQGDGSRGETNYQNNIGKPGQDPKCRK